MNNPSLPIAEVFTSVQGEGVYAGTLMTFFRTVGCTVGKKICQHCDTDFDKTYPWRGGGIFSVDEIKQRLHPKVEHVCFTGGEPLNHDLRPFMINLPSAKFHVETSGTVFPEWWPEAKILSHPCMRTMRNLQGEEFTRWIWITVSPKPGFQERMIQLANEIKVIVPGLGVGEGWPGLEDAKRWAGLGKTVYLQPRNEKNQVNKMNLDLVLELIAKNPELKLSAQLHKYITVR